MFLLFVGGLLSLAPIASYCLFLVVLNRREQPTLIPGAWDFAGVLFAVSGLLCVLGPCILSSFQANWREFWLSGSFVELAALERRQWIFWIALYLGYFALVTTGSAAMLWRRRRVTSLYQIEYEEAAAALARVLARLGLRGFHSANGLVIGVEARLHPTAMALAQAETPRSGDGNRSPRLEVGNGARAPASAEGNIGFGNDFLPTLEIALEPFHTLSHVSLVWCRGAASPLRYQIEAELSREIRHIHRDPNLASYLFLLATCFLFFIVFFGLFQIAYALFVTTRTL